MKRGYGSRATGFFLLTGVYKPLAGKGLVLGSTRSGETAAAKTSLRPAGCGDVPGKARARVDAVRWWTKD
jgi:hypothetical protein